MSKQASPQNASAQAAFRPWCVLCVLNPVNRIPDDFKKPSEVHKHSDPCFMAKQSEVLCLEYAKQVRASFKAAPEATPSPSPAPAEPKEDSEMTLSLLVKSINALGFDVGRNSFYAWLKDLGYLKYNFCYQRNLPSQNALDHGFMRISRTQRKGYQTSNTPRVLITPLGTVFFTALLLEEIEAAVQS